MTADRKPLPELSAEELRKLEVEWYEGSMLPLVERLVDFAHRHRAEILAGAGEQRDAPALVAATKAFIASRGSMHMKSEITDQIREIQKELWYRGERGDHDSKRIKREWTDKHAPAWRRWRINEYLFVADKCATEISKALTAEG